MRSHDDCEHLLAQPYPPFLLQLESGDTPGAISEFSRCATYWLSRFPTPSMRSLTIEEQEDVVSWVVLRLIENNAAKLRGYKPRLKPFRAWLRMVAENRALDVIRGHKKFEPIEGEDARGNPVPDLAVAPEDPEKRILADIVWRFAQQLDPDCLLGLIARYADGHKPKDIVFVLGRGGGKDENIRVSARLSYCEKVLEKLILDAGYEPEDFID